MSKEHSVDGCSIGCALLVCLVILSLFLPALVESVSEAWHKGAQAAGSGE